MGPLKPRYLKDSMIARCSARVREPEKVSNSKRKEQD